MASILSLKRRIKAAQNVSKTTRAMQMIAASKLKRAQQAALAGRPYVTKLQNLTQNITRKIDKEMMHPYMQSTGPGKTLLLFLSPDKGLCGGLITNLVREFLSFSKTTETTYIVLGKKAEAQVAHVRNDVLATFPFGTTLPTFDMVYPLSRLIDEYYLSGKVTSVKILSSEFTSIFTQTPKVTTLLPIAVETTEEKGMTEPFNLFEPNVTELLPSLLKHYLEMTLYQRLLESFVSEQAARMIAMQNATDNAGDIIEALRLEYNKTRQAKITSEILDISGARSMQA